MKSQWQVGYYRIDMVVEGAGKRLAIECDGDRYHPIEKMADDMARQTVLERLGWKFVRIRGSAFYREPELAMRPVFDRLRELGIPPESNGNETTSSDMTLIHELDGLIRNSFEKGLDEPVSEGIGSKSAYEEANDSFPNFVVSGAAGFSDGQVEALLGQLGGTASLENFLHDFAKSKGFQRLGRNVRKGLKTELEMLATKGKISIKGEIITLL